MGPGGLRAPDSYNAAMVRCLVSAITLSVLTSLCAACGLWPRDNPLDPGRCDPRCSGGRVCLEGACVGADAGVDAGPLDGDLALDIAAGPDQALADLPAGDLVAPDQDQTLPDLPTCAKTLCGTVCVDTQTSQDHCGQCDRSCGGGACAAGVCQPATIASSVDAPFGIAVSGNGVFWTRTNRLAKCPVTGCAGPSTILTDEVAAPTLSGGAYGTLMVVDGTNVFWLNKGKYSNYNSIRRCAVTGCTATSATTLVDNDTPIRQITRDATTLYWVVKYGGVHKIALSSGPGSGTSLSGSSSDQEVAVAVDATNAYVASTLVPSSGGGAYSCDLAGCIGQKKSLFTPARLLAVHGATLYGTSDDKIVACTSSGCSGTPTVLASGQVNVSAITADASGVYWTVRGSGTAADGSVRMCSLPGCASGVRSLATGQATPVGVVVDGDFVYWVNNGITATASSGSVLRVRR